MPQSISSTDGIPYVILSPVRQQGGLCTYEKFERVHSCSRRRNGAATTSRREEGCWTRWNRVGSPKLDLGFDLIRKRGQFLDGTKREVSVRTKGTIRILVRRIISISNRRIIKFRTWSLKVNLKRTVCYFNSFRDLHCKITVGLEWINLRGTFYFYVLLEFQIDF